MATTGALLHDEALGWPGMGSIGTQSRLQECLTASWLSERLAMEVGQIDAMRRAGELIAVREPGAAEWRYPGWQFSGESPRRAVPRIVRAAREAKLDDAQLYEVLTSPLGLGSRRRLADLLVEGRDDEVVEAVRASRPRQG
jgi:hypothetical protein